MSDTFTDDVAAMTGEAALPRANGEFLFSAPWQGRAVALAVTLVDRLGVPWNEFRRRLIAAIAADPDQPYYDSWAVALEHLVVDRGLTTAATLDAATPTERAPL